MVSQTSFGDMDWNCPVCDGNMTHTHSDLYDVHYACEVCGSRLVVDSAVLNSPKVNEPQRRS